MIKTATIIKGASTEAVDLMSKTVNEHDTDLSPLTLVTWCERAIKELEVFKDNLKARANMEYKAATDAQGQLKLNSFAILTHNASKGYWKYPASIVKLETELKAKQAAAQKDGSAIKQPGRELDAENDFLFRIQILNV